MRDASKESIGRMLSHVCNTSKIYPRNRRLFLPLTELADAEEVPLIAITCAIWLLRPDLQEQFPLNSELNRKRYLGWCLTSGLSEYCILREMFSFAEVADELLFASNTIAVVDEINVRLPYAIVVAYEFATGALTGGARTSRILPANVLNWYISRFHGNDVGNSHFPSWFVAECLQIGLRLPPPQHSALALIDISSEISTEKMHADVGVNVIGHLFAQLGIGEDVRSATLALDSASVPHALIDFPTGSNVSTFQPNFRATVTTTPRYYTNIIFMPAFETLRMFCERGMGVFSNRTNIGVWPWELPRWPEPLEFCNVLVDEIWAISDFVRRSFEMSSRCPVINMPPCVVVPPVTADRSRFGIPKNAFVFIVIFDGLSSFARKNPMAAVNAFRKAFEINDKSVALIVKMMRGKQESSIYLELVRIAKMDPRIKLLDVDMERENVIALMASCNCLVSLHRAEGFGRGVAEALLLRMPVITTYWSGNRDFDDVGCQYLVEAKLIALREGEYPWGGGSYWAEPDFDAAILAFRAARDDPRTTWDEPRKFSPKVVGARYRKRLEYLGVIPADWRSARNPDHPDFHERSK